VGEGGLEARILKRLRFFFEELVLVEAGWNLFSPPSQ
jgi:hypothetical protein